MNYCFRRKQGEKTNERDQYLSVKIAALTQGRSGEAEQADGTSINQFVMAAVAAKVAAMDTATFFQDHKARADFEAFDKLMKRRGGEEPRSGDELPE